MSEEAAPSNKLELSGLVLAEDKSDNAVYLVRRTTVTWLVAMPEACKGVDYSRLYNCLRQATVLRPVKTDQAIVAGAECAAPDGSASGSLQGISNLAIYCTIQRL